MAAVFSRERENGLSSFAIGIDSPFSVFKKIVRCSSDMSWSFGQVVNVITSPGKPIEDETVGRLWSPLISISFPILAPFLFNTKPLLCLS